MPAGRPEKKQVRSTTETKQHKHVTTPHNTHKKTNTRYTGTPADHSFAHKFTTSLWRAFYSALEVNGVL